MNAFAGWSVTVFLVLLLIFSLTWMAALIPFAMEVMQRSKDAGEHRNRLHKMGPVGVLLSVIYPRRMESVPPARYWGTICNLSLGGLFALAVAASLSSGVQRTHNLIVAVGIIGGIGVLQAGILRWGQTLERLNREAKERPVHAPDAALQQNAVPEIVMTAGALECVVRPRSTMRSAVGGALTLAAVLALRLASDHMGPLQSFHRVLSQHRLPLVVFTISLTVFGFLATFGLFFLLMLSGEGTPMTRDAALDISRRGVIGWRPGWSIYGFLGEIPGTEVADAWSFAEMKQAWRTGSWRSDPRQRRRLLSFTGMMLAIFGGFGIGFVAGPAWLTLLMGIVLFYCAVRIVWSFARA